MILIELSESRRAELQTLRRGDLPATVRDRLEMTLLSDAGWSPPRIARHLGRHPHTVRAALKGFRAAGMAALRPKKPGPEPAHAHRQQVLARLRELLGEERIWTARQLAETLRSWGIRLSARQVRRYLALLRAGYRRTAQTVSHKQDPRKVRRARAALGNLKKKPWPAA